MQEDNAIKRSGVRIDRKKYILSFKAEASEKFKTLCDPY
jgi:hypothetical protein